MSFSNKTFRCDCPITSALDIVGDKWTLVVIKLMLLLHKKTFKELSESDESIAPSILSNRLKMLEEYNFIIKKDLPNNFKTKHYILTEKGISLTPIIMELAFWSHQNVTTIEDNEILNIINKNGNSQKRDEVYHHVIERYKSNIDTA